MDPSNLESLTATIESHITPGFVRTEVVKHFAEEEIRRRADLVVKGIVTLRGLQKDALRIKPDSFVYGADGKVLQEGYTKPRVQELQKVSEAIAKVSAALEKALAGTDYKALEEALKKAPASKGGDAEESTNV